MFEGNHDSINAGFLPRMGQESGALFGGSSRTGGFGLTPGLRERVLTPEALVGRHAGYRNRVLMGPSWRADAWTVLEQAPDLSIAEVARRASCSFATAWQAAQRLQAAASGARRDGSVTGLKRAGAATQWLTADSKVVSVCCEHCPE